MKTPEEIKRGLECRDHWTECNCDCEACENYVPGYITIDVCSDALAYIQQLEQDNAQKDERITWLEMMNAEFKHVLGYIKHAADMGVHGYADALAMFGINMGRGAEEEAEK